VGVEQFVGFVSEGFVKEFGVVLGDTVIIFQTELISRRNEGDDVERLIRPSMQGIVF